ncbi:YqhR family membrane protein [Cohnella thermotolerans]|uniref:YqhR family membrane protein n=1 Tax=Cohnella thermotolerans TaxID=329858 RepID=UPI0003FE970C|nr:YqhR family membrane protein [Cohnella thermotolerans]
MSPNAEKQDRAGGARDGEEPVRPRTARSALRKEASPHPALFSMLIGFFAGVLWGFIRWFAVGLHFTKVPQAFLADPFVRRSLLGSAGWEWIGLLLFIVMSVFAGLIYWLFFGRLSGPWPGIAFGALWWVMLFYVVGPPTGTVEAAAALGWRTLVAELCLYLVWGLFIGYSIAFEYHDEAAREPTAKASQGGREPQPAS